MDYSKYDERTNELIKSCEELSANGDPEALESLNILREIAELNSDDALIGFAEFYIANWYYDRPDVENYHEHLKKSVYHLLRCNDGELLSRAYNLFALDAYDNEALDVAYYYYNAAIRFAEKGDNPAAVAPMVGNLAILFYEIEDYDYAREYCSRGMELSHKYNDSPYYMHNLLGGYINGGLVSLRLGDLKEVMVAYENAKAIYEEIEAETYRDAKIAFSFYELQVMLATGDLSTFDEKMDALCKLLADDTQLHFYITDIRDFCKDLMAADMPDKVEEFLMVVEDRIMESGVTHAIRILYEIKVDYYEMIQNEKNLDVCLREQQKLLKLQRKEKMRIYNYSTQLMKLVLDLQ